MNNMINDLIQFIKIFMQASLEQEMSPQKKWNSPTAEPNGLSEEKAQSAKPHKSSKGSSELAGAEQDAVEWMTAEEHVQQDPQMGPSTLESLEVREDFRQQLETIMDATKVPKCYIFIDLKVF